MPSELLTVVERIVDFVVKHPEALALLFGLYQMYSPKKLPETKGQKLIRTVLELLSELNSQEGNETKETVPHADDVVEDDNSTDAVSPQTQTEVHHGHRRGR